VDVKEPLIEDVSDTALWVAAYRAQETERPDALFRDPLAARLIGERGRKIAQNMHGVGAVKWSVIVRTCIIDAYVRAAVADGVDMVVNLGAGLDTRPYRMELPASLRWVEVDYPKIIQLKEERLRGEVPVCRLERVALDLTQLEARRELFTRLGAESRSKALVLTEGLVPYLSVDEAASLARDLRAQERFRYWVVDYMSPLFHKVRQKNARFQQSMQNAPFRFIPPDWEGFFREQGWGVREMRYQWSMLLYLITPRRVKEQFRHMAGYALLEPR
jgi:methyltransferase (TIGR00027 family)